MKLFPELWSNIFDLLSAVDVVHLAQTCRELQSCAERYWHSNLMPSRVLMPFFATNERVQAFLNIMARCNAIISGSTALQLFERCYYPDSDLDVYLNSSNYTMMHTEMGKFEYVQKETKELEKYFPLDGRIEAVISYTSFRSKKTIQLIVTRKLPIEAVLHFHSTCVMNVITPTCAFALYPRTTFAEKITVVCGSPNSHDMSALKKYRERGYNALHPLMTNPHENLGMECRAKNRQIGDSFTWVHNFNSHSRLYIGPYRDLKWHISFDRYGSIFFHPRMHFTPRLGEMNIVLAGDVAQLPPPTV
ncbi:hypothetical protein F5887DRAFT_1148771 [Amanita rubescens]|nr:hypothetical protein F5887DRAFT_1148771 [Amanita rubescens]